MHVFFISLVAALALASPAKSKSSNLSAMPQSPFAVPEDQLPFKTELAVSSAPKSTKGIRTMPRSPFEIPISKSPFKAKSTKSNRTLPRSPFEIPISKSPFKQSKGVQRSPAIPTASSSDSSDSTPIKLTPQSQFAKLHRTGIKGQRKRMKSYVIMPVGSLPPRKRLHLFQQ